MNNALRSATLIILKDGQGNERGPQVLLLKRSIESRTLPGVCVFPGGLEEVGDEQVIKETVFGGTQAMIGNLWRSWGIDTEEEAHRSLGTALRETYEECGLKIPLLLAENVQLRLVAHWLTPFALKRRYDTYFWAVVIKDEHQDLAVDGVEISEAAWCCPQEAVNTYEKGELDLAVPTLMILMELAALLSQKEVMSAWELLLHLAQSPTKQAIQPIISKVNGLKLYLPGDPEYGDLASQGEIEMRPSRDFWETDLNHLQQITIRKESGGKEIKRWQRVCVSS